MEFDLMDEEISYLKETKYRNFFKEILSAMSPSEITDIVVGKSELVTKLESFRDSQFPIRDDLGRLWNAMISHDSAESLKSLVKKLKLELRLRSKSPDERDEVDLQALKSSVSITEVIGSCADMRNYRPGRNMKCPFPGHDDRTGSFAIYERNNSCHCFGCQRGGSSLDFLMHFHGIPIREAIAILKKFA